MYSKKYRTKGAGPLCHIVDLLAKHQMDFLHIIYYRNSKTARAFIGGVLGPNIISTGNRGLAVRSGGHSSL